MQAIIFEKHRTQIHFPFFWFRSNCEQLLIITRLNGETQTGKWLGLTFDYFIFYNT